MAENREITLFSEPEELIAWAEVYDKQINPSIEDAALLLNYMEGHDYAIGTDAEGKMYRQDMAEENGEIEPFPIDDVIDKVCEWNYDLINPVMQRRLMLLQRHWCKRLSSFWRARVIWKRRQPR